ncbi:amidohydrolase family protein [Prosthecomicrobium sp. N25]|uniref:amidohydrolase family protein n=1 Tax=Prosthecomicrobium sp. N25 TaxID=3129254 RepID=UPI00307759C1
MRLLVPDLVIRDADDPTPRAEAVLVDGRDIVAVGPESELPPGAERIRLPGQLLMPGFVNAHQHGRGISNTQLGYADDILERWSVAKRRRRPMDPYANTLLAAASMIAAGVTSTIQANSPYGSGDYGAEIRGSIAAYDHAGMRAMIGVAAMDRAHFLYPAEADAVLAGQGGPAGAAAQAPVPPIYAGDTAATMSLMRELLTELGDHPRLSLAYAPAGPQWVSDDMMRELASDARRLGLALHMHGLESWSQVRTLQVIYPEGFLAHLETLGALGPLTSIGHAVWLSEADLALAARHGVTLVRNPGSNLRLRAGIAPLADYLSAGVRVAIGTDNTALADDEDLLGELRLAWRLAGDPDWRGPAPPGPAALLRMATRSGAAAMGLDGVVGAIRAGFRADLVALDLDGIRGAYTDPELPLLAVVMARAGARHVRMTMCDGEILYRDGAFVRLDVEAVRAAAAASARASEVPLTGPVLETLSALTAVADRHYAALAEPDASAGWTPLARNWHPMLRPKSVTEVK